MALFSVLVLSLVFSCALSAKIAVFSSFGGSQYIAMRHVSEELASRGHEVVLVVDSTRKFKPSEKVTQKIYQVPYKPEFLESMVKNEIEGNKLKMLLEMKEVFKVITESLLNSTELLKDLKNFDLIVYDCLAFSAVLVGELLDIPRVEILPAPPNAPFGIDHMVPMPVSYVPQLMAGFTDKMTFLQRAMNLGIYLGIKVINGLAVSRTMNNLKVKYNCKPERSYQEAVGDAELLIITADFAIEYSQPLLPGHIMVGPLNIKAPKPLPPDLEAFVSNSGGHGFIIVSFGSNVASILAKNEVDMLATAFGKLKQRVVWRLKGYIPSFLGPNVRVVDWLPQNDLLGHKDIRAFVSHVGHNSIYESAYHGVPLVAFPLYGDQQSNAKKVEHVGLGLAVDHHTVDAQQMFETIERVISEPRFKTEAVGISRLLKDRRRSPLEETADWIEYVIRHGGAKHLRAQVFNIPWYQYYLLDVMALLVAIVALVVIAIRLICRCICHLCCRKSTSKTKKE